MKKILHILLLLPILILLGCKKQVSIERNVKLLRVEDISCGINSLIIIAGESNAGGTAINSKLTVYELSERTSVNILNNNNFLFQSLDIGTNNLILHQPFVDNSMHGIENGLSNYVDSGMLPSPINILKAGQGGSVIRYWNDSTLLYYGVNAWQQMKKRVDTAIKLLTVNAVKPKLYLIWMQGLNNADRGNDPVGWKDSTKTFFKKLRQRFGDVPIFMPLVPVGHPSYYTYNDQISLMKNEVSKFYPIPTSDAALQNANHYSYTGFKIIAKRFIDTLNVHYTY